MKVQGCTTPIEIIPTGSECSEWDEKSFTVPVKGRTLPETPIGGTPPYLDKQIDVSVDTGTDARVPTATAVGDVDVYSAKNEPDGAGHVVGILRKGSTVSLVGDCDAQSWCEVSGDAVPGQRGWVWGHLELPS